jgi:hypothetical protein
MREPRYTKEIELLLKLVETQTEEDRELLEATIAHLQWFDKRPPMFNLQKEGSRGWALSLDVPGRYDMPLAVQSPVIETLRDSARLVFEVGEHVAKELRAVFDIPMQPAPMDATEAMVRAAHALAGAAIELTHVLKKERT